MVGPALIIFIMIKGHTLARNHEDILGKKMNDSQVLEGRGDTHRKASVEREQEYEPGFLPLLGYKGGVSRVLWFILYCLRHTSGS